KVMAALDELGDDARHHFPSRRDVGREVRADDEQVHGSVLLAADRYAPTRASADDDHRNSPTRSSPASMNACRRAWSWASSSIACAQPLTSSGSTSTPASPTTSGKAVASAAITGQPLPIASSTGKPNPSNRDGNVSAVACLYSQSRSPRGTWPMRRI